MMNCRHCDNQLPAVIDAFCPHCGGELADIDTRDAGTNASVVSRNGRWILLVVAVGLALIFLPLLAFPLAGLAFLGVACARSAFAHRQVGWLGGLVFGIISAVVGLAGIVTIIWLRVS